MTDTILAIEHIVRSPEVRFGKPRIAGTRIAVSDIVVATRSGWKPQQIAEELELTLSQIHAALSYYPDHHEDIDQELDDADADVPDLFEGQDLGANLGPPPSASAGGPELA